MPTPQTLFDKIWQRHVVVDRGDGYHLLYIDRHLMHDGSAAGFARLRQRGQTGRRPDLSLAQPDRATSTAGRTLADLITGERTAVTELPLANHRSPNWEVEPLRWLGIRYTQGAMSRLDRRAEATGRPPTGRSLAERIASH